MTTSHTAADISSLRDLIASERTAAMNTLGITFAEVKANPVARQALKSELGRRGWLPTSPVITGQLPTAGSALVVMV